MNNTLFGFEALQIRFNILNKEHYGSGKSKKIFEHVQNNQFCDLERIFSQIFNQGYGWDDAIYKEKTYHGNLLSLAIKNNLFLSGTLEGKEEAEIFEEGKYLELQRSTANKTRILCALLEFAYQRKLRVKNPLRQFGLSPQGIFEITRENWIGPVIGFILSQLAKPLAKLISLIFTL